MKILVTGANGLVGSRLCLKLARSGHEVVGVSRGPLRGQALGWRYASLELTSADAVIATLAEAKPEVVVNPASMTDVEACEKNPAEAYACNVQAPATLALQCKRMGVHLLHVSTDYVFDGDAGPYAEDELPNPRGVYAITKHMGEQAVRALGGSWAIARTAVVYGWPAAGHPNFGSWLLSSLAEGKNLKLFADQYVSPSLAASVAAMLAELAERRLAGVWNTSGATVLNRIEFGEALCARFGFPTSLLTASRMADLKLASPRPARSGLKVDKAVRELKEQPLALAASLDGFFAEWKGGTP